MRTFHVNFLKVVSDGRGYDHRVLQQRAVVSAWHSEAAANAAKVVFCKTTGINDWRQRADTLEIVEQ